MARRDNDKAARALADWARHGFTRATADQIAATYQVAPRTVWNWKAALDDDTELAALFRERLNDLLNKDWAAHLDTALAETVEKLRALIQASTDLTSVVEAFRALSEVAITREVLRGATDAQPHRGYEAPSRQAPADGAKLTN